MTDTFQPVRRVARTRWRGGDLSPGERAIPEETAVAFTYNRFAYAVMMATPADLEDFAVGFSLAEGVVTHRDEIHDIEIVAGDKGVELRMWIAEARIEAFAEHRRYMTGPTGCGLCGVESLAEAMRPPAKELVYMANQIGRFFAHRPEAQAVADTADHLRKFWEPRMRKAIFDYVDGGGQGLAPSVLKAVLALKQDAKSPSN